ncbi:MAG: Eco57I restriction-modification methylase domain-containing protein, partial [Selenomonadaceae bacterium]|nr:Eco57I restriction-modification methylase domain-containing protein [Selenomonadaceae bacterium]
MTLKQQIFEEVLQSAYSLEKFARFSQEFFTALKPNFVRPQKPPQNFSEHIKEFYALGRQKDVAVLAVNLQKNKSVERARSVQRNFVKALIEDDIAVDGAIVAFYSDSVPEKWRLSFVRLDHEFVAGKGGKVTITPAKRYSYLVGENEPCTTAYQQLFPIFADDSSAVTLDDLEEAFSVERVTKEFFDKYAEKFYQVKDYLENNPEFKTESQAHGFTAEQFAKKLLGQIVFLYFLQKKGWLGVEKDCAWGTGSPNFMRDIFKANQSTGKNFFDEVLEPLFYTALNVDRSRTNDLYPRLNLRIPFLNGGLFEELDNYDWQKNNFSIPNEVFSNVTEKGRDADGILDIFDRYNFTINEDEPTEREVAIDPEMLGKVFENLLDSSTRKSKGAFYTPREIVHYMCRETLISYLVEKSKISEDAIRNFILYGDYFKDADIANFAEHRDLQIADEIFSPAHNVNRLAELDKFLQEVKVADLAVGSGAFPLGMLNEITKAREVLTAYLNFGRGEKLERSLYDLKFETIKNSIFACDIEPSAVDIAKLRLWLTLVIDDEPTTDKDSFKPKPLPNLDCNIICGNSLIEEFEGFPLIKHSKVLNNMAEAKGQGLLLQEEIDIRIAELIRVQKNLFHESDHARKEEYRRYIRDIYDEIIVEQLGKDSALAKSYKLAARQKSLPFILWQLYFPTVFRDNGGFDIIVGNPPYIGEEGHKELFRTIANTDFGRKYYIGKMDFWYFFVSKAIELLNDNGLLSFIAPNNWMTTAGGKNMRSHIATETTIKNFITFNNVMIFENAAQQTMIFLIQKKICHKTYNLAYKAIGNERLNSQKLNSFLNGDKVGEAYTVNYNPIANKTGEAFQFLRENVSELLEKIASGNNIFLTNDEILNGIHPHHATVTKKMLKILPNRSKIGDGIFILDSSEIEILNLSTEEFQLLKPYYDSQNVDRYYFNPETKRFIIYTTSQFKNPESMAPYPALKKHLDYYSSVITSDNRPYGLHRARQKRFFENPKIVSLRKCSVPTFAYIDEPSYFTAEWYCIITSRIDMRYLTCLLNSSLVRFWLSKRGKIQGNIFQVDKEPLQNIPIKIPTPEMKSKVLDLYILINNAKKQNRSANTKSFESEIDDLIYQIYDLADDGVNFIKNFELESR